MRRVYLAGPLTGYAYAGAASWRKMVGDRLAEYDIECVSPLRGLEHLDGHPELFTDDNENVKHVLTTDAGATCRCRADVLHSDAVLANFLGATKASIGTCIELGWANAFHKPVVLLIEEKGNVHDHALPRGIASYRVSSLEEAVKLIKLIVLADPAEAELDVLKNRAILARLKEQTEEARKLGEEIKRGGR
jgi:nucleoside 2-deoxyribosyltransferase